MRFPPVALLVISASNLFADGGIYCSDSGIIVMTLLSLSTLFMAYRYIRIKSMLNAYQPISSDIVTHQHSDANLEQKIQDEIEKIRRQEEQIFQQSRLIQMGEMVSMIAHQWRQPLGAIASTAIGIETKIRLRKFDFSTPEGIEQIQNYLLGRTELIAKYVDTLTSTIDDFRSFYQKDKAKEHMTMESVIRRALGIIDGAMKQKGITIEIEYDSRRDLLLYPNEIVQVILNILQNAYDQFKENEHENPKITITVHDIDDVVQIEIIDNAGGIPGDILPKIFRPYFSTKDNKNGTGIGLYMSKTIIEEHHHGFLSAFSHNGEARFVIQIPYEEEACA